MTYKHTEKVYSILLGCLTIGVIVILLIVLLSLFILGHSSLNLNFLTSFWNHGDIRQGGIIQAIIGSLYLGIGVTLISFPLGLGTAIYLTEYGKSSFFKRIIQLSIRNLAGVPSVVYGIFGLAIFVNLLSFKTSLLSAVLTLSAMALPWVITASIEALESVPQGFRQSSLALGASKWQTISQIVLPAALPGCITGGIISLARALGETAPIIMVGATFYISGLPESLLDKFMALSYHTFILSTQHSSPYAISYASATALILILITFILSLGAILVRMYYRSRKDW